MTQHRLSFQELKERVSVIDVASFLGYEFDRSKGITQPSFVLTDAGGDIIDRIYIKNPKDNSQQGYWRRHGINNTGDVISFIKENLNKFGIYGRNDIDTLNKILHKFAGQDFDIPKNTEYKNHSRTSQTFDPDRWVKLDNTNIRDRIFSSRGLSPHTSLIFSKHIDIVQDTKQQGKYSYVGFPYHIPGEDKYVGYELRGVNGFKSKATGTNSTEGMWIASFTDNPLEVRNIYIAESAFDALAFYQLHRERINLQHSAFVSFGGAFSDKQFDRLTKHFSVARPVLLFDKDLNGHMYDIRAIALMKGADLQAKVNKEHIDFNVDGKKFSILQGDLSAGKFSELSGISVPTSSLFVYKPKGDIKDWNDVLKKELEPPVSKYSIGR